MFLVTTAAQAGIARVGKFEDVCVIWHFATFACVQSTMVASDDSLLAIMLWHS